MEIPFRLPRKRSSAVDELREYLEGVSESAESELAGTPRKSMESADQQTIFKPYRAVGLVCDELGFWYHRNVEEKQMTVSVGHAFQTYSVDRLKLLYVGPHIAGRIAALAVYKDFVFTACGTEIYMWTKIHNVFLSSFTR